MYRLKNKKSGFTLVEVLAAVAILGIVSVGIFTFMGRQSTTLSKLKVVQNRYEEITFDLYNATLVDNTIDGVVAPEYTGKSDIIAKENTVTINGVNIDFELLTSSTTLPSGDVMNLFAYNFTSEDN